MLINLHVRNLALIEEADVDFHDHLNILTGETGAGKSILIDAISLLGRERASTAQIRYGENKAIVEGTFDLSRDSHALQVLAESGYTIGS